MSIPWISFREKLREKERRQKTVLSGFYLEISAFTDAYRASEDARSRREFRTSAKKAVSRSRTKEFFSGFFFGYLPMYIHIVYIYICTSLPFCLMFFSFWNGSACLATDTCSTAHLSYPRCIPGRAYFDINNLASEFPPGSVRVFFGKRNGDTFPSAIVTSTASSWKALWLWALFLLSFYSFFPTLLDYSYCFL